MPPQTVPDRPAPRRRADIQGLRAIAVLLVVLYHCDLLPGGFIGVDVFFVVSGFVITALLMRERATTGRIALARFYLHRIRRLLPALAVVSVVILPAAALVFSPLGSRQDAVGRAVVAAVFFVSNGVFFRSFGDYFQPVASTSPLLHTWSLAVEGQFYLVFPVALVLGLWLLRGRARRALLWLAVAALVASAVAAAWLTYRPLPDQPGVPVQLTELHMAARFAFYAPVTRGWEFLAGGLAAVAVARWVPRRWPAVACSAVGAGLLVVAALLLSSADPYPGVLAAGPVLATVCLLLGGAGERPNLVSRVLSVRVATTLGDLSYSWYLWHWPAIVMAVTWSPDRPWVAPLACAAALVPAALSYRFVEEPVHRGRRLASRRSTAWLAVACVGLPAVGGAALVVAAQRSWGRSDLAALQAIVTPNHIDLAAGCASYEPLGAPSRPRCVWTVPRARGTVLLIGDSNAGHLAEPLISAGRANGFNVEIATRGGCPLLLLRIVSVVDGCNGYSADSVGAVQRHDPPYAAVVVSNSISYLGKRPERFAAEAPAGTPGSARDRGFVGWSTAMARTVAAIAERSPVTVIGAVPHFHGLPDCLAPRLFAGPTPGCGHIGPGTSWHDRGAAIAAERAAVESAGGTYLDLGGRLCDPVTGCSAFLDGQLVYRDGAHLSVTGSMVFEAQLRAALGRLATAQPVRP